MDGEDADGFVALGSITAGAHPRMFFVSSSSSFLIQEEEEEGKKEEMDGKRDSRSGPIQGVYSCHRGVWRMDSRNPSHPKNCQEKKHSKIIKYILLYIYVRIFFRERTPGSHCSTGQKNLELTTLRCVAVRKKDIRSDHTTSTQEDEIWGSWPSITQW